MASSHERRNEFFEGKQHMGVVKAIEASQTHWLQVGIPNQEERSRSSCTPHGETHG
jgi:hypothetical protein